MADIEWVIKIPEEKAERLLVQMQLDRNFRECKIVALPKGHGRLIDADATCKDIISALGIRDENYLLEAEEAVYKRIKNAPTIIEADKEQNE